MQENLKMNNVARFCLACLLVLTATCSRAQSLFNSPELLQITLEGDISKLIKDDGVERDWHQFRLIVDDDSLDVRLRVRGNFRRKECEFPPIMVKFDRSQVPETLFEDQKQLKLVTHCKRHRSYSVNTYEEYLAYRLFNEITDRSFRVRLLQINYQDGQRQQSKPAFFIEHVDGLAKRLGGEHIEPDHVRSRNLDQLHLAQSGIFEYMIGNTDFSFIAPAEGHSCCHNAKLIRADNVIYSVPYDFDFSGMVDASYAGANPVVNTRNVRIRQYRGFCTDAQTLESALDGVRTVEAKLTELFDSATGLTEKDARKSLRYVQGFFKTINKSGTRVFEKSCRKTQPAEDAGDVTGR
jgi:hypothetical protein